MIELINILKSSKKKPSKFSIIKTLLANPDRFTYVIKVVDGEVIISIKKNEDSE